MGTSEDEQTLFTAMFDELSSRVFAYARRHCGAATAQDVVSDVFLVAWRRRSELPAEPLPWLLVVARNCVANRQRGEHRQQRVATTLARLSSVARWSEAADHRVVERETMLTALADLSDLEREALLLVAWDGLSNVDGARVAGCSVRAFEVRLSRARARLARTITAVSTSADRSSRPAVNQLSQGDTARNESRWVG